jgi:hypothetical protein
MAQFARLTVIASIALFCGFLSGDAGALTPEQCQFFQTDGRTAICHATGTDSRPFILINAGERACAIAHASHERDFVALDGSCDAVSTLPEGAPCDTTLACSDGLSCVAGTCSP